MTQTTPHSAHFRFSLRNLLGAVAVCAIGFIALAEANAIWVSVVVTLTAATLLTTLLGIVYWSGALRAFAIGSTIWGVAYLALAFLVLDVNRELGGEGRLLTSQLQARAYWRLWPLEERLSEPDGLPSPGYRNVADMAHISHYDSCMQIGQVLWSWIFGVAGGLLARRFYVHGLRRSQPART